MYLIFLFFNKEKENVNECIETFFKDFKWYGFMRIEVYDFCEIIS